MSQNAVTVEYLQLKLTRRPHSPLFARLAHVYLDSGRLEEAKELCRAGIVKYPQYTTAHLVLAKCFVAEQEYGSALTSLEQARLLFPNSPIPSQLYAEVEQLLAAREASSPKTPLSVDLTPSVVPKEEWPVEEPAVPPIMERASAEVLLAAPPREDVIEPPEVEAVPEMSPALAALDSPDLTVAQAAAPPPEDLIGPPAVEAVPEMSPALAALDSPDLAEAQLGAPLIDDVAEDRVGGPAQAESPPVSFPGASSAPPATAPEAAPPAVAVRSVVAPSADFEPARVDRESVEFQETPISDEGRIVSKTLAEIYAAQRQYGEALITYRLLIREKPERSDEFRGRIAELERLNAESGRR